MSNPIAYTYEADHHCYDCTLQRFGTAAFEATANGTYATDNEGNEVGVVMGWDEWMQEMGDECEWLACGDCGTVLDEWHSPLCCATDMRRYRGNDD